MAMIPLMLGLSFILSEAPADPLAPRLSGNDRGTCGGFQAVDIHLPWEDSGYLTLRFPETLHSSLGLLFIDHSRDDMPPVVAPGPLPDWAIDEKTGAASYEIALPNGVAFGGVATPRVGGLEVGFWVRNGTEETLGHPSANFCLVQTGSKAFSEGGLTRSYIHSSGKWLALADTTYEVMDPEKDLWIVTGLGDAGIKAHEKLEGHWYCCPERADAPIIATTDSQGNRTVGITWDRGVHIMSNGRIPCIHCDPLAMPDLPPGETGRITGRVYLVEGGLAALWDALESEKK